MESRAHNAASWLVRHAVSRPAHPAVVDAERTLSYPELDARCARLAGLLTRAGVEPGERVAVLLRNGSPYLESFFAAARLGALLVPVNNRLAPPEIARQLRDCTPRVLIHEADLGDGVEAALGELAVAPRLVLPADRYEAALAEAVPHRDVLPVAPDAPVQILYTSGTTGSPKGALLPQRKVLFNSLNAQLFFGLSAADRVLVIVPLFHSFGLNILSLPVLYAGGQVVLQPRFDPAATWDAVDAHGITFFGAVPTMFQALFDALPAGRRPASLRFLFTAGAAIPVELIRAYEDGGLVLKQGFGQTETSILCCLDARDALRKAGSVGRPVFHAEVRIVEIHADADPVSRWRDVAPGETGEIVVRGPITMLGYWKRPEATAETLREGWLRTGDLAQRDDEGFVRLVGRARDLYISGGENVYPAEVEAIYAGHPDVCEAAVVGVADPRWGEAGCAYLALRAGAARDADALRRWGRERLARFKVPRDFVFVDALPRTITGKVQKHRLGEIEPG